MNKKCSKNHVTFKTNYKRMELYLLNASPFVLKKYGAIAEALLTEFMTNEDLVNASTEELVEFINSKSRGRISVPAETSALLQAAAKNSYRLDKCLYEPLTVSISSSFNCISAFEKELKAIDDAILRTVNGLNPVEYQVLNSIPGYWESVLCRYTCRNREH